MSKFRYGLRYESGYITYLKCVGCGIATAIVGTLVLFGLLDLGRWIFGGW